MKKAAIIFSAFLMAISCSNGGYVIKGDIKGLDEGDLNLLDAYGHTLVTTQVKEGKFTFRGVTEVPQLAYINNTIGSRYPIDIPIMLENARISVKGDASAQFIEIKGTKANENMVLYKARRDALAPDDREGYTALVRETFNANSDNILGAMMITNMYSYVSDEELLECCDRLPEDLTRSKLVSHCRDICQARVETAPGKKFKDFSMEDKEGKTVSLSETVSSGRATLLLFWASWSYGNKSVLPEIAALHRRYADKGVNFIGVSLDSNSESWEKAVGKFNLGGIQIQGDYNKAKAISDLYGIDGMPCLILMDSEGVIRARGSNASELEPFLSISD